MRFGNGIRNKPIVASLFFVLGCKAHSDFHFVKKILKHCWPSIKTHFRWFMISTCAIVVAAGFSSLPPFLFSAFAESFAQSPSEIPLGRTSVLLLFALAVYVLQWVSFRIFDVAIVLFETRVMRDLDQKGFLAIQNQSLQFFEDTFTGSLVKKIGRFARAFEAMYDWFTFTLLNQGARILIIFCVFLYHEPRLAAAFFLWACLFLGGNIWFSLWKLRFDESAAASDSRVGAVFADSFANQTSVKTFAREAEEYQRAKNVSAELYHHRLVSWGLGSLGDAMQALTIFTLEFSLLFLMTRQWQAGEFAVEDFVLFQSYLLMMFYGLWDFGKKMRNFFQAIADGKEMADIFDLIPSVQDKENAKKLVITKGAIDFRCVGFSYSEEESQFHDFSLAIPAGQHVALVGHTGAGKSTLTKLLFRFFDIQSGEIMIDGNNIAAVTQESLRRNISLVPQQPELFHRSIAENIAFGKPGASFEEIRMAAEKAQALDFIENFSSGFDTMVGERGVKLSGGERQRIAIARAFLENSPIVVLDEATSALDSITEQKVQKAVFALLEGRTSVVIAHRLSTILRMDRIIVLEQGSIIEDGTHNELLTKNGVYADMWNHQAGGFLES